MYGWLPDDEPGAGLPLMSMPPWVTWILKSLGASEPPPFELSTTFFTISVGRRRFVKVQTTCWSSDNAGSSIVVPLPEWSLLQLQVLLYAPVAVEPWPASVIVCVPVSTAIAPVEPR